MLTTISGCNLYYEQYGQRNDASPELLFLHGWGCDSSIFSFIASDFARSTRVTLLDFPGHGKSGEPSEAWGVPEYAMQLKAFLDQMAIDKVSIVAHSFGGRVAIYLASQYPEYVGKLLMTGAAGIKKPASESQQKRTKRFKRYQALWENVKKIGPLRGAAEAAQAKLRNRYGSPDYVKLNENMRKTFVKVISQDLLPMLSGIRAPTLLIWGSDDTETPLWMGQTMESEIPDAGLVVFEGASHFAFLEQWQRFLLIARQFFLEESRG